MEVIGVGFGRTGTTSLKQALDILGFGPTYHTREIFKDPSRLASWADATARGTADWDVIFDGYHSTVDWPAAAFWRELVDYYPEAKVILTVRDPLAWQRSCMRTIFMGYRKDLVTRAMLPLMRIPLRLGDQRLRDFRQVYDLIYRRHFDPNLMHDQEYAVAAFSRHIEEVKEYVPGERLLVYELDEGWPKLCKFLGVGVTFKAFPHANDQESFDRTVKGHVKKGVRQMAKRPLGKSLADLRAMVQRGDAGRSSA